MSESLVQSDNRALGAFSVGPIALGLWRFTTESVAVARALVEHALERGVNLFDNADVYGLDWGGTGFGACEALLGKVLADAPDLRDRMVVATKGGIAPPVPYDQSPTYLRAAVDASLTRLNVDVIDLYQIHRPDLFTHPADVAEVLTDLRATGKIREVGVSNFTPAQIEALAAHLDFPLVSLQPQFSAANLDPLRDGRLDLAMRDGLRPLAWSPLGGGALVTGEGVRPELIATLDRLAEREEVDRAAIAIAFVLAHPSRPVAIIGTQRPARIDQAMRALDVSLHRTDCYEIIEASEGVPLP